MSNQIFQSPPQLANRLAQASLGDRSALTSLAPLKDDLEYAAQKGGMLESYLLAQMHYQGWGASRNKAQAFAWMKYAVHRCPQPQIPPEWLSRLQDWDAQFSLAARPTLRQKAEKLLYQLGFPKQDRLYPKEEEYGAHGALLDQQAHEQRYCRKLLAMVSALHGRGYQRLRICPYGYHSMWWHCAIAPAHLFSPRHGAVLENEQHGLVVTYSSSQGAHPFDWPEDISDRTSDQMAGLFLDRYPLIAAQTKGSDCAYAGWYQQMMLLTGPLRVPQAFETDYDHEDYRQGLVAIGPDSSGPAIVPFPPLPSITPGFSTRPDSRPENLFD